MQIVLQGKYNIKSIQIMTLYNQIKMGGVSSYETPLVKTLDILSEGVLCGSYDTANFGYYENDLEEI